MSATLKPLSSAIKRATRGHGRFAGAHVALQQAAASDARRPCRGAISRKNFRLRGGQFETEPRQKRFDQAIVAAARQRFGARFKFFPARLDLRCNAMNSSSASRRRANFDVVQFFGKMKHANGIGARRENFQIRRGHGSRISVSNFSSVRQMSRAQPALRQALGQRINRRDAVDVDDALLAAFDDFGFGMVHRARLGFLQFSENKTSSPIAK
jgi:hypothetical protein